jgi:hypothetical protein
MECADAAQKNRAGNLRLVAARHAFPLLSHMENLAMTFFSDLLWYKKRGYSWRASAAMAKNTIHLPATEPLSLHQCGFFQK